MCVCRCECVCCVYVIEYDCIGVGEIHCGFVWDVCLFCVCVCVCVCVCLCVCLCAEVGEIVITKTKIVMQNQ